MNNYERRWANAVKIAETINGLLRDGWIILDGKGQPVAQEFIIKDDEILLPFGERHVFIWFIRDSEYDNGCHSTIAEYNAKFDGWKCVHPDDFQPLRTYL